MAKQGTKTVVPTLRFPEFRKAPRWAWKALSDVCEMQAGKFVAASEIAEKPGEGAYPCYGGNGLRGYTTTFTHSGKYPLIGRQGALCGNIQFVEGEFYATEHALVSTPRSNINVTWLYYTLDGLRLNQFATGQAQPGLSVDVLNGIECAVPATEIEQQKIAACLTSLDEVIAAQGRKVEALKTHKRGLMQQLFPREGETRPRLRFPEFRDAPEWKPSILTDVCRPQQWRTISSSELTEDGYPVYGANGFIGRYPSFNHEFETVAVTCRGSTCGEVLLIPPKSYITGNSMCLDEIDATKHSYHFIFHLLKHRGLDDVISGSAQPQIVGQAIKKLKFLLPDLPEQQRIADCLASLDTQITAETARLAALKTHKQGLMQQLFPVLEGP